MTSRFLLPAVTLSIAFLSSSCLEDKKKQAEIEAQKAQRELELQQNRERIARERAEKKAAKEAEAKRIEEEKLAAIEAKKQAEREAEDERLRELARIEAEEKAEAEKEAKRKAACARFKGTQFEKLTLTDGTVYENAKVTNADAIGVSIMYAHGLKRIPFTKLSEDIREACLYDPDAAERRKKLETKRIAAQYAASRQAAQAQADAKTPATRSSSSPRSSSRSNDEDQKKKITPKGSISVRVTRMFSKYYPQYRRKYHTKTLSITAVANVDASLYFRGSVIGSLKAGERGTFTTDSWIKGQYEIVLKDRKTGKVLDMESDKRKSGL